MHQSRIALAGSTMLTATLDHPKPALIRARTTDSFMTFDQSTVDSTGAFLISELERLDPKLHEPLVVVTWGRDIDLRSDVTIADEVSSFTNSTFASPGGMEPGGKAWIGKSVNAITGIALDIGKTAQPLHLWGMELSYTLPELAMAAKLGRPIDQMKFNAMQLKYQMDIGYAVAPTHMLLPPIAFSRLVANLISTAGSQSILNYLRDNSLSNTINGTPLIIAPVKWLAGRGVGGLDRAIVYSKSEDRVRFPLTPLNRTPIEYRSLYQMTTYWGRIGQVEFVFPETAAFLDGI